MVTLLEAFVELKMVFEVSVSLNKMKTDMSMLCCIYNKNKLF